MLPSLILSLFFSAVAFGSIVPPAQEPQAIINGMTCSYKSCPMTDKDGDALATSDIGEGTITCTYSREAAGVTMCSYNEITGVLTSDSASHGCQNNAVRTCTTLKPAARPDDNFTAARRRKQARVALGGRRANRPSYMRRRALKRSGAARSTPKKAVIGKDPAFT